ALAMGVGGAGALLTLVGWLPAIVAGLALCSTGVFMAQASTSSYIGAVTTRDRALAVGLYSTFYYAGGSMGAAAPAALWAIAGGPSSRTEQLPQLGAFHDFDFEQSAGHALERVTVVRENLPCRVVRFGEDALHLGVDFPRRLLGVETAFGADRNVEKARALVAV